MSDTLRHHPLADIFPLMEGAEFNELVADIKASGLHEPIILLDDLILDGRNRYRACVAAGVEPSYRPFTGEDPGAFVISANIRRRHLNTEQKRAVIAKLLEAHPEKSDRQIAETAKASPTTVGTVRAQMESTVQSGLGVTPSQIPPSTSPRVRPRSQTADTRVSATSRWSWMRWHQKRFAAWFEPRSRNIFPETNSRY